MPAKAEAFIAHYASQYYDPQKAHDYYIKKRQLSGKSAPLTKSQSEGIGYAKSQIGDAKKRDLDKLATDQKTTSEQLKAKAEALTKKIADKLAERLAKETEATMRRLANLPEDASPEMVKKLLASHSKTANKARAEARKATQQLGKQISDAISKARNDFTNGRDAVTKKYDQAASTEEANIRAQVR